MTYCIHKVTEGYCLDCLRAERDALRGALTVLVDAIDGFKRGGAAGVAVENYDNALAQARAALASPPPHDGEGGKANPPGK